MRRGGVMTDIRQPAKCVQPIHFEDFGGLQFERLVFAYHARNQEAVGMRCRECLLALVRELTQGSDLAEGDDLPKTGDFVAWNERIANAIAPGNSAEYIRGYLKTTAERAWRLVNWL